MSNPRHTRSQANVAADPSKIGSTSVIRRKSPRSPQQPRLSWESEARALSPPTDAGEARMGCDRISICQNQAPELLEAPTRFTQTEESPGTEQLISDLILRPVLLDCAASLRSSVPQTELREQGSQTQTPSMVSGTEERAYIQDLISHARNLLHADTGVHNSPAIDPEMRLSEPADDRDRPFTVGCPQAQPTEHVTAPTEVNTSNFPYSFISPTNVPIREHELGGMVRSGLESERCGHGIGLGVIISVGLMSSFLRS